MSNFTSDDLLLYLYKETTPEQNVAIEAALESDWSLRERLAVLKESLPPQQTFVTPSAGVLSRIMDYANGVPADKLYKEKQHSA